MLRNDRYCRSVSVSMMSVHVMCVQGDVYAKAAYETAGCQDMSLFFLAARVDQLGRLLDGTRRMPPAQPCTCYVIMRQETAKRNNRAWNEKRTIQ